MELDQRCYMAAILLNGIYAGCYVFASAVDARYLGALCDKKDADVLRRMFPVWWPFGRDLMTPVGLLCIAANTLVYFITGEYAWLYNTALGVFIMAWTIVGMLPTIKQLQSADLDDDNDLYDAVRKFCKLHHVRSVAMLFSATITAYTVALHATR